MEITSQRDIVNDVSQPAFHFTFTDAEIDAVLSDPAQATLYQDIFQRFATLSPTAQAERVLRLVSLVDARRAETLGLEAEPEG